MRSLGEFITHVCAAVVKRFDGDIDSGILFVALLRQADLGGTGAATPISFNALSRSLARPFETVRRLCNRLCDLGLAERNDQGIFVPRKALELAIAREIRTEIHDNFVRMIVDQVALGYPLPLQQDKPMDRHAIELGAIDLLLFSFEFGVPAHPMQDWQRPYLYLTLMTANARPYTFDRELAWRYSDITTPPADEHRMPVGASALARAIGIPYTTVRRNLKGMVAEGRLIHAEGSGYLINMAWMQSPTSAASGVNMVVQLDRVLRQVAAAGFPFDDPAIAYREGPPVFLDFR